MLGQGAELGATRTVTVRFPVSMGAAGIKPGSPVTLGGQKIGKVSTVAFFPPGSSTPPTDIDVAVQVPKAITLFDNASFALDRPLLGSLSSINISSSGSGGGKPLVEGAMVRGGIAPPAILSQAGISTDDIAALRHSFQVLDASLTKISIIIDKRSPDIDAAIGDAQTIVADIKKNFSPWSESVDSTLKHVNTASAKLTPMLDNADSTITESRRVIESVRQIIADNREAVQHAITSIESAATKLDQKTVDALTSAFAKAQDAIESVDLAMQRVSTVVTTQTPNVERIIANIRLMSDNLKLTAIEVRSQPWRLLHAPDTKELSTQAMYDATRAFAEASSDLRAASQSLNAVAASRSDAGLDAAATLLRQSMEKYRGAEQRLLDVLIREEKK